jgi:hypothetical protein
VLYGGEHYVIVIAYRVNNKEVLVSHGGYPIVLAFFINRLLQLLHKLLFSLLSLCHL